MMVQWSVNVSPETDQRLQSLLKQKGQQKELLSQYVEEAVKEKLRFEETVSAVQERNLSYSETEIEMTIQEAIRETRATNRS
jgi:predicted transcriptional regulator